MSVQTLPDAARLRAALAAGRLPDERGRFGPFGGRYVPETLIPALERLERGVREHLHAPDFQQELAQQLTTWVGRPTALTFAARLSARWGAKVWLKREDLAHTGAHKINNAIGQALLAKRLGARRIVAETGAGQHGVASAAACARLGLPCTVYMGEIDMQRQAPNVGRMRLLGTQVVPVTSGDRTLRAAIDEALRDWVADPLDTYYLLGSAVGPHPYPYLVRELQAVIGREARAQLLAATGALPDALIACVGGGSNSIGAFHAFVPDDSVEIIGVEAGGKGAGLGDNAATVAYGRPGVLHGTYSMLLQNEDGQIQETHSVSAGLDYPGVGPEHALLAALGRVRYETAGDAEALEGVRELSECEGILPALESAHAIAGAKRWAQQHPGRTVLICLSGRGDKDMATLQQALLTGDA
ncbi:MAG TPA: tryptophan synthase subunit beta [Steroidobacteraceae bacterium]|nr:tryptophan synthase subunit beta [Steroidobacteraceae bacterium]